MSLAPLLLAGATGSGPGTSITVLVAIIAAIPGIGGLIYTFRTRKEAKQAQATEFGTEMAKAAFQNMESQVTHLSEELNRQGKEMQDRGNRITELQNTLHLTNQYLQLLLVTLDLHGISRPAPPPGFNSF